MSRECGRLGSRSRAGLRSISCGLLVVAALVAPGCGSGDAVEEDEPTLNPEERLNQVLERPDRYDEVTVDGLANPLGHLGFTLSDGGVSAYVQAPPSVARSVDDGEEVQVTAEVKELSERKANAIDRAIELDQGEDDAVDERAFADTRIAPGAAYLKLVHLQEAAGA